MAQRAVFELQVKQFLVQSFVLADLASVILFFEDALATGDARRKVSPTILAVDVALKR